MDEDSSLPEEYENVDNFNYEIFMIFILIVSGYLSYILTILICAYWLRPYLESQQPRHNPQHDMRLREALVGEESSRSGMNSVEDLTPFGGTLDKKGSDKDLYEDIDLQENYHFLKLVGKGRTGKVFKARTMDTNEYVAIKVIAKNFAVDYIILREWMNLRLVLSCPFVVQCRLRYETLDSYCFVMDYLSGGTLADLLQEHGKLPESYIKILLAEVITGMEALHNCGILIRDLKADNIMFDSDGHIKLIDFGSSEVGMFGSRKIRRGRADVLRLCPEMLIDLPYDHGADLWALGILLWELLLGDHPFQKSDDSSTMEAIIYDDLPDEQLQTVSTKAALLLQNLLEKEPERRMKLSDVKEHPFLQSIEWDKIKAKAVPLPFLPLKTTLKSPKSIQDTVSKET